MNLAIMQPYFFPYLGYFDLMMKTDRFIVFDDVQYIRRGWVNRNRILKPGSSWQYITVPIKTHKQSILIKNVETSNAFEWKSVILRQLEHYKKFAPYFNETCTVVQKGLNLTNSSLSQLNVHCLNSVCEYLEISAHFEYSSQLNLDYSNVNGPGDWALEISKQLGAKRYINPSGGENLYSRSSFIRDGIDLEILPTPKYIYNQRSWKPFESNLSVIDAMMFNSPSEVKKIISGVDIIEID